VSEALRPEVMVRQVLALAGDLRTMTAQVADRARGLFSTAERAAVGRVHIVGDGDSYHAGCAAELAFESIADVACTPVAALRFLEYGAQWMRSAGGSRPLVIATSASGETERVVQAVRRAREYGALTVALTGVADSAVAQAAERSLVVALAGSERSPGIRTYQASLVGMFSIAIALSGRAGLVEELAGLADDVEAAALATGTPCAELAAECAGSPVIAVLGSGPNHGTAQFTAAKLVEGAGVLAFGQDLEEWCHVERFAYPLDMPVFVLAAPGRAHWRAVEVATRARELGRRVVIVGGAAEKGRRLVVPVTAREEFSPLVFPVFAGHLAAALARTLGRLPFQAPVRS
jgi:glucosamine--fructose-6-phosphate aminotransferase (isomerizing)